MSTSETDQKIKDVQINIDKIFLHLQLLDEKCKVKEVKYNTELLVSEKLDKIMTVLNEIKLDLFLERQEDLSQDKRHSEQPDIRQKESKPTKQKKHTKKKKVDSDSD